MEEADRLADTLLIVNRGRAVVQGTPESLKASLHGDTLRVSLVEPDAARVREAVSGIRGLRDLVVEATGVDGTLVARSDDASAAVGAVIAALDAAGIRFGQVAASHPTLDDVYLHFVGHSYDAGAESPAAPTETGAAA
jgi:ABC-2 type transport system ATP-binding protein